MIKRYLSAEIKSVNKEEGTFEVIASSGKQDRFGDTIDPKGWYLKNYKKNPVILWSHSTGGLFGTAIPPVAKASKVWVEDEKELKLKGKWADTPFAIELRTLVEGSFLNAVSVGFLPLVEVEKGSIEIEEKFYRRATDEEIKKGIYDSKYGEKFTKQELLEVSWVNVPALPQALVTAREMNLALVTKALEEKEKEKKPEKVKEKETKIEKEKEIPKELPKEKIEIIKNFVSETEKAISVLKEKLPEIDATPTKDTKGRKAEKKTKSRADKDREAEIKLLRLADKAIEAILRKLRQEK